ncbi:MAG: hypothetical protein ACR2PZ_05900 [Pseudomonadales bacterium]
MVFPNIRIFRSAQFVAALVCAGLLVGCGGGSDTGSSNGLGGGQDPDPVLVDFPIAYVKRPLLVDDNGDLLTTQVRSATQFFPGAELFMRDRASPSAVERSLTVGIFPDDEDGNPPLYDVKDLDISSDGQRVVFAMRAPEDPNLDDDEQPTWNIWLYSAEDATVTRIIASDLIAEDGQDIAPRFLPDDRIVFSSTRQRLSKAVLLDEGKPQFSALDEDRDEPALTLHVMQPDGSDMKQITYNQSSDLDPMVFSDGRVVYARWDNIAGIDRISLYRANPDGSENELLYGIHSHDTGPNGVNVEFVEPKELPDGRLLVMLRPGGPQSRMGALPVAIDVANYVEHDQPTFENQGLLSDAQELLIPGDISLEEDRPPLQGRYAAVNPLFDGTNRLIVSWSQCRLVDTTSDPDDPIIAPCTDENLVDPNFVEADPLYGVWMHDLDEETQQPIVVPEVGEVYSEVVVLDNRTLPPVILDKTPGLDIDADLVAESVGVLHIRSIYDFDGTAAANLDVLKDPAQTTADERPARFLRIIKPVSMPDDDLVDLPNTAFGRSQINLMREVIGYAPIEPDGSVKVKVPANIAFAVEVLDVNGRRISAQHRNWLQLRPGEEMNCNGCHSDDSELPHGRYGAEAPSANAGASADGSPFPNTEPALFANLGETMAEVITRINGIPRPTVDVLYTDVWTDPNVRAKDPDLSYPYSDLPSAAPVDAGCVGNWSALCRITINYETHVHPLWSADRQQFDAGGALIGDNTCTTCHAPVDAAGMAMVPMAQLDLSDGPSPDEADHFISYRELLFPDNEVELVDGAVIDRLIPALDGNGNPIFETDADGNQILDADGNPIPVLVTVNVAPPLTVVGANFSPRFFDRFAPGGTHASYLNAGELKLLSEWADIGAQYYNDPFAVPQ